MLVLTRLVLAAALSATAFSAIAAERSAVAADPSRAARVSTEQSAHLQLRSTSPASHAEGAKSTEAVTATQPGQPRINAVRAYPPSCLADPLPDGTSGPLYRNQNVNLAAFEPATGNYVLETVTITIWRVACSSHEFYNSATLMRIQRQSQYEGDQEIYPLFPAIRVRQGSIGYGNSSYPLNLIRVANEPNTIISDTLADAPVIYSTTYVLENYPSSQAGLFDFNLAFGIQFNNQFSSNNLFTIDVPLYNPTSATYPDAFTNLPISGYISTNWYDPTHDGEGLVIQTYESPADSSNLTFSFTWFAYDSNGIPFWFFGSTRVPRGARSVTSPMAWRTGGGFAGSGGTPAAPQLWGSVTFSFPTCSTLNLSLAPNAGLPAGVPTGTGSRIWTRLANVNGLPCE